MAVGFSNTNKPLNPRGNDASPKGYNRAALYSGKALDFDGVNDYVDISAIDETIIQSAFSFHTIIKKENNATDNDRIIDITIDSNNAFNLITDDSSQKYAVYLKISGTNEVNQLTYSPIVFDELAAITFTWDGSNGAFYYNGQLVESTGSATIGFGTAGAFLGKRTDAVASTFFNGLMSGVRLFNTALTAAQVADLYNNPEKVVPTGVDNTALKLWLPMMEGAGTTAYDGSGNGNHGTISGATYVNGIGAPVAQSAVIDWNKGTNYFNYSESFSQGYWVKTFLSVTEEQATAPNGLDTADKFTELSSAAGQGHYTYTGETFPGTQLATGSVYLKDNDRGFCFAQIAVDGAANRYTIVVNLSNGSVTDTATYGSPTNTAHEVTSVGNGWYRLSVSATHTSGLAYIVFGLSNSGTPSYTATIEPAYVGDGSSSIYSWGAQLNAGSVGAYVPTFGTSQDNEVLLPQGLTSGRDITGVNLFENVRKQGALNLDGNSWAEVHDNASFDFGTDVSLEAWVYWQGDNNDDGILGRYGSTTAERDCTLYAYSGGIQFYITANAVSYTSMTNGWRHIVGTYDGANKRLYVDGVQVNSSAETSTMPGGSIPLEIGRYNQSASTIFTQPIAQPRIYNRALTAEEVQRNYNAGKNTYTN